jgi:hypothetical protein
MNAIDTKDVVTPDQMDRPVDNMAVPMETKVVKKSAMTAMEKLKDELKSARNLDVGFDNSEFNIDEAIAMIGELDKYTKVSVFNTWRFFLNMQCIRQALRILPNTEIEKTAEGRDQYDHLLAHTMDEYEKDGDYATKLPAFIALNEKIRVTMYEDNLDPASMDDTLAFMTEKMTPKAADFEADYDARVNEGMRPGLSKRDFCEMQLADALKQHELLTEQGQAAIQFCNDLQVVEDRGHGDLPDWAITTLYNKCVDKLAARWGKLDIRRTGLRTSPNDRTEAQADQTLIEFVYEQITGRRIVTEY